MVCIYGGAPPLNTDIGGTGVRVSDYLQTLCLTLLAILPTSLEQRKSALYTLGITNTAMTVTALFMGLKANPEISFQDALVVLYLMFLSANVGFLTVVTRIRVKDWRLHSVFATQNYTTFIFSFVVLIMRKSFGSSPECNANAVFVYFGPFHALKAGWILWLVVTISYTIAHTLIVAVLSVTYLKPTSPVGGVLLELSAPGREDDWIREDDWASSAALSMISLSIWGWAVLDIELLIRWNHFAPSDGPSWQFGQILPLILVVIPLSDTYRAFRGLKRRSRKLTIRRRATI